MINRNRLNASHQFEARKSNGATAHAAEATKPMTIPAMMIREGCGVCRRPGTSGTRRPGVVAAGGLPVGGLPTGGLLTAGLLAAGLLTGGLPAAGLSAEGLSTGGLLPVGLGGGVLLMDARIDFDGRRCTFIGPAAVSPVKREGDGKEKSEIRMSKEIQNPKFKIRNLPAICPF